MAVGGHDPVAGPQILADGGRLCRRFDDDDVHSATTAGSADGRCYAAGRESETRLPGCRSKRPANSSSSKMVATVAGVNRLSRTRRSTGTGLGP